MWAKGHPWPLARRARPAGDIMDLRPRRMRDAVDRRIVESVRTRTSTYRANAADPWNTHGPWPDLASGAPAPPVDSDHDGMPDAWERAHGLDPTDPEDGPRTAANGYTHVENYLNELAGDPIP